MRKVLSLLCIFVFLFASASIAQKKNKKMAPDFYGFKGTLLVNEAPYKKMNKVMVNKFKKFYKGEFIILEEDGAKGNKAYADTRLYRFEISIASDGFSNGASFFKFMVLDRVTGTYYSLGSFPDNTIPPYNSIGKYVKELEDARAE